MSQYGYIVKFLFNVITDTVNIYINNYNSIAISKFHIDK